MELTDEDKLNLIRDSLIGVSYHLPTPEVFLYPFMDNLLLLHQRPLVFALWEGDRQMYSSLKDPNFRDKVVWDKKPDAAIKILDKYYLSVHEDFLRQKGGKVALPIDKEATALTQRLIESFETSNPIFGQLKQTIDKIAQQDSTTPSPADNPNDMDYDEVKGFLEPMRCVFDEVFVDAIRSNFLMIKEGSPELPNIFAVIRTCPRSKSRYGGNFGYTAGLFLLNQTKDHLKNWCVRKCCLEKSGKRCELRYKKPEECISAIEQPLGLNSRAVSDFVFSSGLIDFGRKAGEHNLDASVVGRDRLDRERRYVEECIYPPGRGLLYIPIHVGGTPWIAIFTFAPSAQEDAWYHNYSFYRDLMQKSAALIRQKAHDCYAELVAKTLVKHMESWAISKEAVINHVNIEMQKIAQVYPFPMLKLHLDPLDGGKGISVSDRGIFEVSFKQNPFFPRQVDWNIGNENEILYRCQEALKKFEEIKHSAETKTATQLLKLVGVESLTDGNAFDNIIGSSTVMKSVYALIHKIIAAHDVTVLITGENGTGKELVAEAIHYKSTRSEGPFIKLNCSAIPEELLESELFGYVKGAFTGAKESRQGKFELANKGTIFLDEIGDMHPELQAKLLRVIEGKEFYRVGDKASVSVDVRIIAATNQDLQKAIKEKRFREDLYYRLCVTRIQLPPLRDRKEDIPFLTKYFLEDGNNKYGKNVGISDGALNRFMDCSWPGNVRELKNTIHRLVIMCDSEEIKVEDVQQDFQQSVNNSYIDNNSSNLVYPENFPTKADWNTVVGYLNDCLMLISQNPTKSWRLKDVDKGTGNFKSYINEHPDAFALVVKHNYEKFKLAMPILQKNRRCRDLLTQ